MVASVPAGRSAGLGRGPLEGPGPLPDVLRPAVGPADPLAPLIEDHHNGFLQNVCFLDFLLCVIFLF